MKTRFVLWKSRTFQRCRLKRLKLIAVPQSKVSVSGLCMHILFSIHEETLVCKQDVYQTPQGSKSFIYIEN